MRIFSCYMRYLIGICSTCLYVCACNPVGNEKHQQPASTLTKTQLDSVLDSYNFSFANPVIPDSSAYILFPLGAYGEGKSKRSIIDLESSISTYDQPTGGHWNMLFFHIPTQQTHLLSEHKILIADYKPSLLEAGPLFKESILYLIHDTDFNSDGKLDRKDPRYLYLSDRAGKSFRRISPEKEYVTKYQILPGSDQMLIQARKDTNGDLVFGGEDELVWYFFDVNKNISLQPILDSIGRKSMEEKFFKQWLQTAE